MADETPRTEDQPGGIHINISQDRAGGNQAGRDQVGGDHIAAGDIAQSSGIALGRQAAAQSERITRLEAAAHAGEPQRRRPRMHDDDIATTLYQQSERITRLEVELRHLSAQIATLLESMKRPASAFGPTQWWIITAALMVAATAAGFLLSGG